MTAVYLVLITVVLDLIYWVAIFEAYNMQNIISIF